MYRETIYYNMSLYGSGASVMARIGWGGGIWGKGFRDTFCADGPLSYICIYIYVYIYTYIYKIHIVLIVLSCVSLRCVALRLIGTVLDSRRRFTT